MDLKQLVMLAQQGDKAAMQELCCRFTALIHKHAGGWHVRSLGQDAAGEGWLAFLEAVHSYKLQGDIPFEAYAQSKVRFKIWNYFKQERRRWKAEQFQENGEGEVSHKRASDNVEQQVIARIDAEKLKQEITRLPVKQRQAIVKTVVEAQRLSTVAKELGISVQAVNNLKKRGFTRLKNRLSGM